MSALNILHRWMLRAAAAFTAAWLIAAPVTASFDDVGAGARGAGMADAQTAVADDASASFNNPAGLIQVGDRRLATEFGQYARGLTDGSKLGSTFLSYVHPLKPGDTVLSAGYRSFSASDILVEKTYLLGGGQRLNISPFGWEGVWSVGGNIKMLERSFVTDAFASNAIGDSGSATGQADPILANGGKKTAYSVDAGVLYQFGRRLDSSLGLVVLNGNKPNLGIQANDHAPQIIKFGAAHRPRWGLITAEIRHAYRLTGQPDTDFAIGAERNFRISNYTAVVLRGGYAEGSRGYQVATAGAAYHFGRYSFDYSFSFPIGNLSSTDGSQRIGFSMRFGSSTATVKAAPVMPPMVEPLNQVPMVSTTDASVATFISTDTANLEEAVSEMKGFRDNVEENVATLQREIDALRKAAGATAPVKPAEVATSTPTPVVPVVVPATTTVVAPVPPAPKRLRLPSPNRVTSPKESSNRTPAAPSAEAAKSWKFYQEAVERDISDPEKVEILESMLVRFGEKEAGRINLELEKIRRRSRKAPK